MSQEIVLLGWSVVLGLVQVMLAAGARRRQDGLAWAMGARDEERPQPKGVGGRLVRAQNNMLETFPFFAAAILAAHAAGREGPLTLIGAHLYFWGRLVYVPLYASGIPMVRSIVWGIATIGIVLVLLALLQ